MQANGATLAEALFIAKVAFRELNETTTEPAVLYNDLIHLLSHHAPANSKELMAKINASLPLRTQYMELVSDKALQLLLDADAEISIMP